MAEGSVPLIWPGRDVFVVGAGASLIGFDWSKLTGRDLALVAVNRALEQLPDAQMIYFSDFRFWRWHRATILAHAAPFKFTICPEKHIDDAAITNLRRPKRNPHAGLADDPAFVATGNCSGYAAINVAVHAGARRVILIGFDMQPDAEGRMNYHEPHRVETRPSAFGKMLPYFSAMSEALTARGITVLNTSMDSAIRVFPKVPLDDVLDELEETQYGDDGTKGRPNLVRQ